MTKKNDRREAGKLSTVYLRLAEVIGTDQAALIVETFPGARISIPEKRMMSANRIYKLIGEQDCKKLIEAFGGTEIKIPQSIDHHFLKLVNERNEQIVQMRNDGALFSVIARRFKLTKKTCFAVVYGKKKRSDRRGSGGDGSGGDGSGGGGSVSDNSK